MKADVAFPLEQADWPAILVDGSGTVRRANQAALGVFGPGLESAPALAASLWAPENELRAEQFLAQLERAPTSVVTLKLRVKGGVTQDFQTHLCPVTKEGQKYVLFQFLRTPPSGVASAEPVALASERAEEAAVQKQKLECALQLARTVALDFNNALTSILGHVSLLLGKMEPNHPWRHSLLEVEKSAERAAEVAHHLVAFSRQDKEPHAVGEGNVNQLLHRAVNLFRAAPGPRVEWVLQLEGRLFSVTIDEAKVQQAFVKILENAVEAIGDTGTITVRTRNASFSEPRQDGAARLPAGSYVCVEISDTGPGIDPQVLPRIFDPFFTTKRDPKHRGLGLAWVYGIITNHGGSVAVSSQPGKGTVVRVYLPALKKIVPAAALPTEDLVGHQAVLVVDDEELLVTMMETVLAEYGYRVTTAKSGQKALQLLASGLSIDLLVTDLVMPGLSGRELIAQVRRLTPDVRVLCVSGYARAFQASQNEVFLQKPFTAQQLLRKVKEALAPREAPAAQ
jgi:two-component system cell cycle sensor histidine kinase/response regulator CckA